MRISFVVPSLLLVACGNDSAAPDVDAALAIDAAPPDAPAVCPGALEQCDGLCVNTRNDDDHCGACDHACTAAARCETSACACPAPFLGGAPPVLATTMLASQPGFTTGAAGLLGNDSMNHALVITAALTAPLGTPLAVNANNQVFAAIAYEVTTATQSRATYLATAGTVTLTRRCAAGLAGSVANLTLAEVDPMTFVPTPGGCTTTVAQLAFDIAGPCL